MRKYYMKYIKLFIGIIILISVFSTLVIFKPGIKKSSFKIPPYQAICIE